MKMAFLSDIHEDVCNLRLALQKCEQSGIDQIVCLGDIVGYSLPYYSFMKERDANQVIDIIRSNCKHTVIGNHDLFAIRKMPSYLEAEKKYRNWYDRDFEDRKMASNNKLFLYEENELHTLVNKKNISYLESLPEYAFVEADSERILLSHYAFPDSTGCMTIEIRSHTQLSEHFAFMGRHEASLSFSGNDHLNGFQSYSPQTGSTWGFERVICDRSPLWTHGPAIARGTTPTGFLTFDTRTRELEAVLVGTDIHTPPIKI